MSKMSRMGLTKEYLRYISAGTFNIVASNGCNAVFVVLNGQEGRYVAVGACEYVFIWDLRLGEKAHVLPGEISAVTRLCASPNKKHLAVGLADGNVHVYDLESSEIVCIFAGHRADITALAYDSFGHKLASGSKDTDIIVWDTVAEVGICRLSGHKGPISQIAFMAEQPVLISGSKDSFVKFWDLDTQHCFKTLIGHRTEVWSVVLMKDDRYLVTGCADAELRVWKLTLHEAGDEVEKVASALELATLEDTDDSTHPLQCHKAGSLLRSGKGRVTYMCSDSTGQVIACQGTDNQVELFYFLPDDEANVRLKKRAKKERRKEKKEEEEDTKIELAPEADNAELSLRDEVRRLPVLKLSAKPKSVHLILGSGEELRVATTLANNVVELHSVPLRKKDEHALCLRSIKNQGHWSEVRAVGFSSDNLAVVSGSGESVKLWNRPSQTCLRSIPTGYVLSAIFVPGDRHVLAGLKDGQLLILDIASGDVLEEIPAHTTELWSICLNPDLRGCATGGGDKTVKFWQFELIADKKGETKAKVLSLLHKQTLKLDETALCVRISANGKFLAVALLDCTVKIFFMDTFKFYLSLYGHKLPVLCMDISTDCALIATGSADRNVKIWGMNFGDCHKSIFAHDDSITGLQFVTNTHYFFTCGKDGRVKEWDADSFAKIVTLQGHIGEAYGLAVSPNGKYVVSCGSDRALRMYEKSDQLLILEDEEEEEREKQESLATGEQTFVAGQPGLNLPSKKTVGSEKAAENILECLEVCKKYRENIAEHAALQGASTQPLPSPPLHPLMQAYSAQTPEDFLLEIVRRIRASDLEEALLLLPFAAVCEILEMVPTLVARGDQIELSCKLLMFLLKIHHGPIIANHTLLNTLRQLQKLCLMKTGELRNLIGYNFYGLQFLQREIEVAEGVQLFRDATIERKKGEKKRRQKEKRKRSIISMA